MKFKVKFFIFQLLVYLSGFMDGKNLFPFSLVFLLVAFPLFFLWFEERIY